MFESGERKGQGLAWMDGQRHTEMETHADMQRMIERKRPVGRGRDRDRDRDRDIEIEINPLPLHFRRML